MIPVGAGNPHRTPSPSAGLVTHLLWTATGLILLLVLTGSAAAGNWPTWRGPEGTGTAPDADPPIHWSPQRNVRWRTALPARGNSTPVVWENRVFLTQAIGSQRLLMCFERDTGRLLWQRGRAHDLSEPTHETNPPGSSSPVTDGERVIAWFGGGGLACYDFEGTELWHRDLGPPRHIWGWGSSPVLWDRFCFLNFGPGDPSFIVALNKATGDEVWRQFEPHADSGEKKPGQERAVWAGSWSTPIVISVGEREELILSWPHGVRALAPATGRELWSCAGLNPLVYTSPLYEPRGRILVAMGGYAGMALAVKAGGSGDVTFSHRLWHHPKTRQRIGSGVIHQEHIYILNDPGIAECFQLQSGQLVWEERLRGPAPKSDNWSSMIVANGRLYAVNQGGDGFVLKAGPKFQVLATNTLGETVLSSPAAAGRNLFIRSHEALWCLQAD